MPNYVSKYTGWIENPTTGEGIAVDTSGNKVRLPKKPDESEFVAPPENAPQGDYIQTPQGDFLQGAAMQAQPQITPQITYDGGNQNPNNPIPTIKGTDFAWTNQIVKRYETNEAIAYMNYHKRMLAAGAVYKDGKIDASQLEPILIQHAALSFQQEMQKVNAWHDNLKSKLDKIDSAEIYTGDEKDQLRKKVLDETNDPLSLPELNPTKIEPKGVFSPLYIAQTIGEIEAKTGGGQEGTLATRKQAVAFATKRMTSKFGDVSPAIQEAIDRVFPVKKAVKGKKPKSGVVEPNTTVATKRKIGDTITRGGKPWKIAGFDTDGDPLVDEVK
jgi:hypothetical protein